MASSPAKSRKEPPEPLRRLLPRSAGGRRQSFSVVGDWRSPTHVSGDGFVIHPKCPSLSAARRGKLRKSPRIAARRTGWTQRSPPWVAGWRVSRQALTGRFHTTRRLGIPGLPQPVSSSAWLASVPSDDATGGFRFDSGRWHEDCRMRSPSVGKKGNVMSMFVVIVISAAVVVGLLLLWSLCRILSMCDEEERARAEDGSGLRDSTGGAEAR